MENQNLFNSLSKYFESLTLQLKIKITKKTILKISNICYNFIEKIATKSGVYCDIFSKSTISEENFEFVIKKLRLTRYKLEIFEEKKRSKQELLKLEKIYA